MRKKFKITVHCTEYSIQNTKVKVADGRRNIGMTSEGLRGLGEWNDLMPSIFILYVRSDVLKG